MGSANSGIVATLEPHEFGSDHPLAGVFLQQQYEAIAFEQCGRDYLAPIQRAQDYLTGKSPKTGDVIPSSYQRGTHPFDLHQLLPPAIHQAVQAGLPVMDQKWRGKYLADATLVGPEMRGSSPLRIERDRQTRECPGLQGLYPVGEGAGYAGGIVTAAVDGLRTARVIVSQFAPLEN